MFENIEKIIRGCGNLYIEEEKYGSGLLAGFDLSWGFINNATDTKDATVVYKGTEVKDAIDEATSPGDADAMEAFFKLEDYAMRCPEFLYVRAETFEEVMQKMEIRANAWNALPGGKRDEILLNFVSFKDI